MTDSAVEMILLPEDDAMHPMEDVSNFNESAYYNFFDPRVPRRRLRADRQPPERGLRRDDRLLLPARRLASPSCSKRPEIDDNARHDAGGLRFEVVERR